MQRSKYNLQWNDLRVDLRIYRRCSDLSWTWRLCDRSHVWLTPVKKKKIPWPIFQSRKTNSEGRGGGADKEERQMAQEIGIRIYKRENSEKWRHRRRATPDQHGNTAPPPLTKAALAWPSSWQPPVMRTPHQVNKVALNDVQRRDRVKNKWGGQRVLLGREIEGLDGRGRRGKEKMKDSEHTHEHAHTRTQKKERGMMEGAFVPVECWRCLESRCRSREENISL